VRLPSCSQMQCCGCRPDTGRIDSLGTDALLMTVADRLYNSISWATVARATRWRWSRWPLKDTSWLAVLTASLTHLFQITYSLHAAQSFIRSYPVLSQTRNSPHFMEPEVSLRHSQVPAIFPYPEPARSSPYTHILNIDLSIFPPSTPGSPKWSRSLRFHHKNGRAV